MNTISRKHPLPRLAGLLAIATLLALAPLSAQGDRAVDSLETLLAKAPADTSKINLLFRLYAFTAYNDLEQAKAYIAEALELSKALEYSKGIVLCYDKLGGAAMINSEYDLALTYFRKADRLLDDLDWPRERAVIYGNYAAIYKDLAQYDSAIYWNDKFISIAQAIGNKGYLAYGNSLAGTIYHYKGQYELAVRNHYQALKTYEVLGDLARMADELRLLGEAQTQLTNYDDAEESLKKAIGIYRQTNDDYYLSQAYRDRGYNQLLRGQYDDAELHLEQAMTLALRLDDRFGQAQVFDHLSSVAFQRRQYESALDYAQKALALFSEIGDPLSEAGAYQSIASILIRLGLISQATEANQQAEAILRDVEVPAIQRDVYDNYHQLYLAQGRPADALKAFKSYVAIKDSLLSVKKATEIEELQLIYEVEKKDQAIALLGKDLAIAKLRRQRMAGLAATLVLIACAIIYGQYQRRVRDRKLQAEKERRQAAELEKNRLAKAQLERELTAQALQLCKKNELLNTIQEKVAALSADSPGSEKRKLQSLQRTIRHDQQSDSEWEQFLQMFRKVHPKFLDQLRKEAGTLSPAEQRLACLLKMNLSSREIATTLNISEEGIKKARYRLRKKLTLESGASLQEYLHAFSL